MDRSNLSQKMTRIFPLKMILIYCFRFSYKISEHEETNTFYFQDLSQANTKRTL